MKPIFSAHVNLQSVGLVDIASNLRTDLVVSLLELKRDLFVPHHRSNWQWLIDTQSEVTKFRIMQDDKIQEIGAMSRKMGEDFPIQFDNSENEP